MCPRITPSETRMTGACAQQQEKPLQAEACTPLESSPHSLQLEKVCMQQ